MTSSLPVSKKGDWDEGEGEGKGTFYLVFRGLGGSWLSVNQ